MGSRDGGNEKSQAGAARLTASSVALIMNPRAGAFARHTTCDHVARLAAQAGLEVSTAAGRNRMELRDRARTALAAGCHTVIACGGDGTVSAVAAALAGTEAALGVLPMGTLNHFAKDLGLPLDAAGALRVIAARRVKRVDIGEVNGRPFINNSSLGLYPNLVIAREQQRRRGASRTRALLYAIGHVLRRYPFLRARVTAGQVRFEQKTPFVFVGNNMYEVSGLNIGSRERLDGGRLHLCIAAPVSRVGLVLAALRALFGAAPDSRALTSIAVEEAWIETRRRKRHITTDGEVTYARMPLHYTIRPRALQVIVP